MRLVSAIVAIAFLLSAPAHAQRMVDVAILGIEQRDLAAAMRTMLERIHEAQCSPNRRCARARPEELENLPLTPGHARLAARTGMVSGLAKFCGMEWEESIFSPYMAAVRNDMKLNQRETALMTLMHGYWQGVFGRGGKPEDCAPGGLRRVSVEQYLASPPKLVPLN
jgi:hypothetical protein